ncbi:MAG: hypothetical protein M1825_000360 [Sarcosagium campestre]|nr:MAG: hypothetical protein M1825_000360 [Sarcosagium campestre]
MNAVDGSEHYERESDEPPASLLTIIIDTNPRAWAALSDILSLSQAVANILVFINAHIAFNYTNQVAVIASHSSKAQFLYPPSSSPDAQRTTQQNGDINGTGDVTMAGDPDASPASDTALANGTSDEHKSSPDDANKYRPFRLVEEQVMRSLRDLMASTTPSDIEDTTSTMLAGALTLALAYINKQTILHSESHGGGSNSNGTEDNGAPAATVAPGSREDDSSVSRGLQSRILVVSVSSDLAFQYIPVMNCIFAAQRKRIPIDVLKLASSTAFLQQAADATRGIYMHIASPRGLLQYLMMAFLPDQSTRRHLVPPTQVNVDFRAACFCHKNVIDLGFVCSICLSIFCEPPEGAICQTCGTHLQLGDYGSKPAVVPRRKKKRKKLGAGNTPTPQGGIPGVD